MNLCHSSDYNLIEQSTPKFADAIAAVANARIHLGIDSFANHLTNYFWRDGNTARRVPGVILWGSTQWDAAGYPHNTNLSAGLHCQPCFRENPTLSRMPRGPCINPPRAAYEDDTPHACMEAISVETVVEAALALWKKAGGPPGGPPEQENTIAGGSSAARRSTCTFAASSPFDGKGYRDCLFRLFAVPNFGGNVFAQCFFAARFDERHASSYFGSENSIEPATACPVIPVTSATKLIVSVPAPRLASQSIRISTMPGGPAMVTVASNSLLC